MSNDVKPEDGAGGSAALKQKPRRSPPKLMPPWKVLLHNDDKNDMEFVVVSIIELTPLNEDEAVQRMVEAHKTGVALLLTTHKERAELYQEQFTSKGLTVTIEPAEQPIGRSVLRSKPVPTAAAGQPPPAAPSQASAAPCSDDPAGTP